MFSAAFFCSLCVCQHDNFQTSKHMMKLGGRCTVQKSRPSSNLGVVAPLGVHPQKCGRCATTLGKSAQAVHWCTTEQQCRVADAVPSPDFGWQQSPSRTSPGTAQCSLREHSAVTLRRQNFCSPRNLACGTLFRSSCAIQTSPTDCSDDS